ncbi:MAG: methylated-DNA--[protein]-cysteine S-methyltransferase [Acidobacteria bacterium]|nr:MAG: methylated-DNA--[protein]-cysteine S-methyltransferase [Acidobacteriota bacterium]
MTSHFLLESPIGTLTLVKTNGALSGLYMGNPVNVRAEMLGARADSGFEDVVEQLQDYFARKRTEFTVRIAPTGTAFQQRVWAKLRTIPYGETRSYGQLADAMGNRSAMRAVGAANGRNPISIIVPCHRVIGRDGTLVGYGGGLERKRFLLELEGATLAPTPRLF